jgi:hypothetical protein
MRVLAVLLVLLTLAGGTLLARENKEMLLAQDKEKLDVINISFSETVDLVAGISDTYFKALDERKKTGVLKLSLPEIEELRNRILALIGDLEKFSDNKALKQPEFSDENKVALGAALTCANCSGKIPKGGQMEALVNQQQLRNLLLARCNTILQLLPRDDRVESSQQALFSLEVHFSYLRQISIAFETAG